MGTKAARSPALPEPVAATTERAFAALSASRGRRIFHPQGIAYLAALRVREGLGGVPALAAGSEHEVVARLSRGLGLARGRPDFLGLALRIGDGEQDLLLASSSPSPLVRMAPLPARSFFGTTFSSLLPFAAGARPILVGALVHGTPTDDDDQLDELANTPGPVAATLLAVELGGRWRRFGTLELGERLPDAEARRLRFDPWNCAGGLVPHGFVNRLRAPAYRGSRRGRPSG